MTLTSSLIDELSATATLLQCTNTNLIDGFVKSLASELRLDTVMLGLIKALEFKRELAEQTSSHYRRLEKKSPLKIHAGRLTSKPNAKGPRSSVDDFQAKEMQMEELLDEDPELRKMMAELNDLPFGDLSFLLFKVFDPFLELAASGLKDGFENVVTHVNELRAVLAKTKNIFGSSAVSGRSRKDYFVALCCITKLVLGFILSIFLGESAMAFALLSLAVGTPLVILSYGEAKASPSAKKIGGAGLVGASIGALVGGPLGAYCGSSFAMGAITLYESYRKPVNEQETTMGLSNPTH